MKQSHRGGARPTGGEGPTGEADSPLVVRGLSVNLGGRPVLRGVDLTVSAGELVGLIGPNGAGKTTLIRAILGLVPAAAGSIECAAAVGYVPQRHEFAWDFPISVRDAVLGAVSVRLGLLARPRLAHHRAVERALAKVGMRELADRPVAELSGGQRQRVLVARALALEPSVLLLDEPFTGLDMPTQELLMDLFAFLAASGCAVLMTTHDLVGARAQCDRLCLINGTVIGSGAPDQLRDADVWVRTFEVREDNPLLSALGVVA